MERDGSMTGAHPDLALAHLLADVADVISLQYFNSGDAAWRYKSDGSPVSVADEQIEHDLRELIRRERPDDGVLGEEFGISGRGRRRWVIDAIDGTASFLNGEPEWSTLVALEEDGSVLLGLVTAPALRRRWWATRGNGAWTQTTNSEAPTTAQRVTIAGASSLGDAAVGIWPGPTRLSLSNLVIAARLANAARRTSPEADWSGATRSSDSIRKPSTGTGTCHGALLVATGQLDVFVLLGAGSWDIAALVPIIEEAGGTYSELSDDSSSEAVSAVFTNPELHQQVLNAISPAP
jgi:histidinol-phosphatase